MTSTGLVLHAYSTRSQAVVLLSCDPGTQKWYQFLILWSGFLSFCCMTRIWFYSFCVFVSWIVLVSFDFMAWLFSDISANVWTIYSTLITPDWKATGKLVCQFFAVYLFAILSSICTHWEENSSLMWTIFIHDSWLKF